MKMRIQIDFARPAWYSIKHLNLLGAGLMLLGIVFLLIAYGFLLEEQQQQENAKQAAVTEQVTMPIVTKPMVSVPALTAVQTQMLTAVIAQINAPWNELLTALEAMKNKDIALINILPNYQKQQLEIIGDARNIPALMAYIESLESLSMLDHVTLQKHAVEESHPYQPVEFVLVARWR